jgi:lysophospholipase L1-like esterase
MLGARAMSAADPTPPPVKYRWPKLAAAIAIAALGVDLFHPRSRFLRFGPPFLIVGGLLWAAWLLFLVGVPEGAALRRRFKSAAATTLSVLAVILGATLIRLGPTPALQQMNAAIQGGVSAQSSDTELGWAPVGKGRVGQRLDLIDPGKDHLLLVGDSIIYGQGLAESEHVGRRLEERMPRFQVLNAAVSGYSIDQYYLYLKRIIDEVKPRAIVVGVFTGNDYQITAREFSWGTSKPLFIVEGGELVRANEGASCIDDLSQSLLFRTLWRSRDVALGTINTLCAPRELHRSEAEAAIARLFVGIDELGQRYGVRPLFLLLPVRDEYNLFDRERFLYTSKYRDLRRLLVLGKHDFHEPFPAIARASKENQESLYLEDHAHFTAKGHQLLAQVILEQLGKRGVAP